MAQGSKKKYTSKQKRKAHDIEKGYKNRGVSSKEAERRAWATVNKSDKGGRKKGGEVAGKSEVNQVPAKAEEKVAESRAPKAPAIECWRVPPPTVIRAPQTVRENSFRSGPFLSCSLGSLFAESCARLLRQMRNRSLSPCSFGCLFDVPLRSGALCFCCHNFT